MFVHGGTDDVVPVVAKHDGGRRENLRVDDVTECDGGVQVTEECGDIWMAEQDVGGTVGARAGDADSVAAHGPQGVGDEGGWSGDVR